ncbi:hypothetical protein [Bradyrhizobium sp. BR 10289]|nr:hypothetical protein [Bradyrhizobium sp. BR 10289]MBW7970990.1 hypothetical protein [Bradyrhizobium sp. BR 10289]
MNWTTILNAADWHATMAIKAYRKKKPDYEAYRRHIKIADELRAPRGGAA